MNFCQLPKVESFNQIDECEIEELDTHMSWAMRILELVNVLELTEQDYLERKSVQQSMVKFLKAFYSDCELYIFGSSINGMGCRGCDLDLLFMPFPEYSNEDFQDGETSFERVPNPLTIFNKPSLKKKLLSMNETQHLLFTQKVLYKKPFMFERVIFIPAKCPILNITLKEFNFECDLSATNKLVVHNSELLRFYGSLDSRVRPLTIALRYWAKSLGFVQKSHLSSYAFCFMVIFALQNTNPPILPSVEYLLLNSEKSHKINGWESAFCSDISKIPKSENDDNVMDLLLHFFEFYWKFDFMQNIVSPHHGKPLPIAKLKKSSDENIATFQVSTFSVQDPFILNHNISRNASMKTAFKMSLLVAKDLIVKGKFCLKLFFNPTYYQKQINSWHVPKYDTSYVSDDSILFPLKVSYNCVVVSGLESKNWVAPPYETVIHAIYEILQYGLLMECEIIEQISAPYTPPKSNRRKEGPFSAQPLLYFSIQCIAYHDTWNSRKSVTEVISEDNLDGFSSAALRKEHEISKKLLPPPSEFPNPPLMCFQCNGFKYSEPPIRDLTIVLRPLINSMQAYGLGGFLKGFIPKTVDKIFDELCLHV